MSVPPSSPHIVSEFDAELADIARRVADMGSIAAGQLRTALDALQAGDADLAAQAVAADARLDAADLQLDEAVIRILALRQPMALDLRETVASLRVGAVIERIGDLAKNVARRVPDLAARQEVPMQGQLLRMGRTTHQLLVDALAAYEARDSHSAVELRGRDVAIDNAYKELFETVVAHMAEEPAAAGSCALLLAMAKNIERIGDHATFLAEMAHFVAEGKNLDHPRPKGDPWGLPPEPEVD